LRLLIRFVEIQAYHKREKGHRRITRLIRVDSKEEVKASNDTNIDGKELKSKVSLRNLKSDIKVEDLIDLNLR